MRGSAPASESATFATPTSVSLAAECQSSIRSAIDSSYATPLSRRAEFHTGRAVPSLAGHDETPPTHRSRESTIHISTCTWSCSASTCDGRSSGPTTARSRCTVGPLVATAACEKLRTGHRRRRRHAACDVDAAAPRQQHRRLHAQLRLDVRRRRRWSASAPAPASPPSDADCAGSAPRARRASRRALRAARARPRPTGAAAASTTKVRNGASSGSASSHGLATNVSCTSRSTSSGSPTLAENGATCSASSSAAWRGEHRLQPRARRRPAVDLRQFVLQLLRRDRFWTPRIEAAASVGSGSAICGVAREGPRLTGCRPWCRCLAVGPT